MRRIILTASGGPFLRHSLEQLTQVTVEEALAHPDELLAVSVRVALGAGVVLFVCGTGLAIWRATGRMPIWRAVLAPVSAAVVLGTGTIPLVAMATLLAMLVAMAVIEHRQPA